MFGRMDSPALQRETEADAKKKYPGTFGFFWHNRRLIKEIEALEHRSRRPDVLVDDDLLFAFYESRIPKGPPSTIKRNTGDASWILGQ
jgi:ATP-dependent helicase HrpA